MPDPKTLWRPKYEDTLYVKYDRESGYFILMDTRLQAEVTIMTASTLAALIKDYADGPEDWVSLHTPTLKKVMSKTEEEQILAEAERIMQERKSAAQGIKLEDLEL